MTVAAIQAALESRLYGISPTISTAWQNVAYEPALARANAVAARFAPVQTLTSGATNVEILSTAHIAAGFALDGWWVIPVSIPWRSFS